jgi:tRNA G18 (ribose-2'-O)-methylase SpoU
VKTRFTLIGLEIEGEWNIPLLSNAAEMFGASLLLAHGENPTGGTENANGSVAEIDELLGQFDQVLACEATKRSRSVYEFPAPRGHLGVIVGNERSGIPGKILKKVNQVVSVPMLGRGMSSLNVAVAAAIILYVVQQDLGRKRFRTSALSCRDVDVLVLGPSDPSELGSLLRSAWALGWHRVFLADRSGVWFTKDRQTVLAGRAAARGEVNRLVVSPWEQRNLQDYSQVVVCGGVRSGTALSRFTLPDHGRMLLVYGDDDSPLGTRESIERIYVDHPATVDARFRHAGSILLSVISQRLKRGRHG